MVQCVSHERAILFICVPVCSDTIPRVRSAIAGKLGELALSMQNKKKQQQQDEASSGESTATIIADILPDNTSPSLKQNTSTVVATNGELDATTNSSAVTATPTVDSATAPSRIESVSDGSSSLVNNDSSTIPSRPVPFKLWSDGRASDEPDNSVEQRNTELLPPIDLPKALKELAQLMIPLTKDEQDTVRAASVQSLVGFFQCYEDVDEDTRTQVLHAVLQWLSEDKSRRVRCALADRFMDMLTASGPCDDNLEVVVSWRCLSGTR